MTTYTENITRNRLKHINIENQAIINLSDEPEVLITDDAGRSIYEVAETGNESSMWMYLENTLQSETSHPMHDASAYNWDNYTPLPESPPTPQTTEPHNKWLIGGATAVGALLAGVVLGQVNDGDGNVHAHSNRLRSPTPYIRYTKSQDSEESLVQNMNEEHLNTEPPTPSTAEVPVENYHYNAEIPYITLDEPNPSPV